MTDKCKGNRLSPDGWSIVGTSEYMRLTMDNELFQKNTSDLKNRR